MTVVYVDTQTTLGKVRGWGRVGALNTKHALSASLEQQEMECDPGSALRQPGIASCIVF